MPGLGSAARPAAGVVRRATTAGERSFAVTRRDSSSTRCAAPGATPSMPRSSTRVDVKKAAGVAPRAVPVHLATADERGFWKRQPAANCEFLDQRKRAKVSHGAAVKMPAAAGQERLKKRLAVELDALRELVEKAKLLSRGKNGRFLSRSKNGQFLPDEPRPVVAGAGDKVPSTKRIKTSPIVEKIDAPEEGEIIVDEECIDICGGVSPVAICAASPLHSLDKADESSKINIVSAAEQDEFVDICGGATPLVPLVLASEAYSPMSGGSDSESSSSSDSDSGSDSDDSSSDSDSESESDSDEIVSSPAPAAAPRPPKGSNSPAQPAKDVISVEPALETEQSTQTDSNSDESVSSPAPPPVLTKKIISSPAPPSKMVQSTKPEKKLAISVLLARAKEAREIREQRGNGWEREKTRRVVREMEKAVLPDESIHAQDLAKVGINEFHYVLGKLGISLRPDV